MRIKIGIFGEEIINIAPEYEDAKEIAEKTGIPIKNVMKLANEEFRILLDTNYLKIS